MADSPEVSDVEVSTIDQLETVWLVNGWSQTVHNVHGVTNDRRWATACGQAIQRFIAPGNVETLGIIIQVRNLNKDRMKLCRICWPPAHSTSEDR